MSAALSRRVSRNALLSRLAGSERAMLCACRLRVLPPSIFNGACAETKPDSVSAAEVVIDFHK